jgi:hypothetical protein
MVAGKRKVFNLHAPMIAAGIGNFLGTTQISRAFDLKMEPYDEETKPAREWNRPRDDEDVISRKQELDAIYSYLRHWAAKIKLNLAPPMPPEMLRRFGDNVNGLVSIADSCGPEWGERARKAMTSLRGKKKAENPKIVILRHGIEIFDTLKVDQIKSTKLNQELKRLDLPDAKWTGYRGSSDMELAHSLEMHEQAALLELVGIKSTRIRPPDEEKQCRGYTRAQFKEALRKHGPAAPDEAGSARGRLRLAAPD